MKVVSSKQMALIESEAYRCGASEETFMEEAGKGIANSAEAFINKYSLPKQVYLLAGKGNNGGDAYVAGRYLLEAGCKVTAYQALPIKEASPLCQLNHSRFCDKGGIIHEATNDEKSETKPLHPLSQKGIILDGLFGTGFRGIIKEPYVSIIRQANASGLPILAIDIPSGLNGDTGAAEGEAIYAKETLFLGLPKTGFFLQEGWDHVGKLRRVPFGLPQGTIDAAQADILMLSKEAMRPLLPPLFNSRHKYQAGYVVGLGGSPGMPGAALLAGLAALRTGAGIVKLLYPKGMEAELSSSPYELIKVSYETHKINDMLTLLNQASATFIGPGLGRTAETKALLHALLPHLQKPCVIDADALTLIAGEKIPFPEHTILTPHAGEMIRLLKRSAPQPHTEEFLHICQEYAEEHQATVVLKGGPTFILHPEEKKRVNPHGDPGMATAGSGDVLTGVIAALLAQKLPPHKAACLGVYLHGMAGEAAAKKHSSYTMIAGDLIAELGEGYKHLLYRSEPRP